MPKARLRTMADCRRFLSRLILDTREGKVEPGFASRLTYMVATLGRLIEGDDIERRIAKLEENIESSKK
jgi:hypothetical protein